MFVYRSGSGEGVVTRRTRTFTAQPLRCYSNSSLPKRLVITAERTNHNEDAQLFRVGIFPRPSQFPLNLTGSARSRKLPFSHTRTSSNCSQNPKARWQASPCTRNGLVCCLVFIKDRHDPTQMERARVHSWFTGNLREVRTPKRWCASSS